MGAPTAPAVAETVGEGVEDDIFADEIAGDSFPGSRAHNDLRSSRLPTYNAARGESLRDVQLRSTWPQVAFDKERFQ